MNRRRFTALFAVIALMAVACGPGEADEGAAEEIGGTVTMARADWNTGWMQAAIYQQVLTELGYEVSDPAANTREPSGFYPALATGQFDLWVNGWFPSHEIFLDQTSFTGEEISGLIQPVGFEVRGGALEGFLIDKATADEMGITSTADLASPDVAAVFDTDGNGLANLAGCNEGWGCNPLIDSHIEAHDWGANVEQVVGDYWSQIDDVQERIEAGEPALFYTWTPNWTVAEMVPGEDVVWLENARIPDSEGESTVAGLPGCASDPCDLGFLVQDIRPVARTEFLEENPAVERLLEAVEIPLEDIQAQNVQMNQSPAEYTNEQIQADAAAWIEANRDTVNGWLETARGG